MSMFISMAATVAKKLARVMTRTSLFLMWVSSWASTPSSSSGSSRCMMPSVTQTREFAWLRPVAKAFGTSVMATAILGLIMSARSTRRSIMAWRSGYSSGVTTLACMERSTSLSEAKYWMPSMTAAMTTTKMMGTPRAIIAVTKNR